MTFKVGDPVRLKSGGNLMTVEALLPTGYVRCQWFDEKRVLKNGRFPSESLTHDDGVITF